MARKSRPSSSPWSKTATTPGCDSRAAERASRMNRAVKSRVVGEVRVHDLQRDLAVEPPVERQVDGGHAAAGDARLDGVAAVDHAPDQLVAAGGHGCRSVGPVGRDAARAADRGV